MFVCQAGFARVLVYLNSDSLQEDGLVQDGSALSRGGGLGVDEGDGIKD